MLLLSGITTSILLFTTLVSAVPLLEKRADYYNVTHIPYDPVRDPIRYHRQVNKGHPYRKWNPWPSKFHKYQNVSRAAAAGQLRWDDLRCGCKVSGGYVWQFDLIVKGFGDSGDDTKDCGSGIHAELLREAAAAGAEVVRLNILP